jgi:hypothetical protein
LTVDHDRLRREIDEEVRRRREAGDLPPEVEQGLHDAFAAQAPHGALGADLDDLLRDVEEQSFFDSMAPVASARFGGAAVKRALRTVLGFSMRHLTAQMGAFAHATGRALHALADRLDALEQEVGSAEGAGALLDAARADARIGPIETDEAWGAVVEEACAGAPGPVLRIEGDDALAVLGRVAGASLGTVVVGSDVEHRPRGWTLRLIAAIGRKVADGGAVVVVSRDPESWAVDQSPVVVDLAPGRPLHAETWVWLLARHGFTDVSVAHRDHPRSYAIVGRRAARV